MYILHLVFQDQEDKASYIFELTDNKARTIFETINTLAEEAKKDLNSDSAALVFSNLITCS